MILEWSISSREGDDFGVEHFLERGRRFWNGAFPRMGAMIVEWMGWMATGWDGNGLRCGHMGRNRTGWDGIGSDGWKELE